MVVGISSVGELETVEDKQEDKRTLSSRERGKDFGDDQKNKYEKVQSLERERW